MQNAKGHDERGTDMQVPMEMILGDEAWACVQGTGEVAECFEKF